MRFPLALSWTGVDLFFVLSGFLIGGILLDNRDSSNYFRVFYARRALRILPLYLVMLASLGAGVYAVRHGWLRGPGWEYLFANPYPPYVYGTFTQNFLVARTGDYGPQWSNVTWSLAVEEQFYFILPLFIRLLPTRSRRLTLLALIGGASLFRAALIVFGVGVPREGAYTLFPARMDALFLGVLLAVLFREPGSERWLRPFMNRYFVIGFSLLLIPFYFYSPLYRTIPAVIGYTVIAVFFGGVLVHAVAREGSPPNRICRHPWLQRAGRLAYGIYLFHVPVLGLIFAIWAGGPPRLDTPATVVLVLLAFAVTLLLAELSFRYFENPLIRFGHRYRYEKAVAGSRLEASTPGLNARAAAGSAPRP
jgi:peptidoglycan/LPS O-acetylase OafA/YrhL